MKIPVFYDPRQVATDVVGVSPSAGKPASVVASWKERGFPIAIQGVKPATVEDLVRAHDPRHVADVLACRTDNGFGNKLPSVAKTLPWTSGSMLSAARHLVASAERRVAVSPTSGFHHADYDRCEGFCTFNGLMVTVLALKQTDSPVGSESSTSTSTTGTARKASSGASGRPAWSTTPSAANA